MRLLYILLAFLVLSTRGSDVDFDQESEHGHGHGGLSCFPSHTELDKVERMQQLHNNLDISQIRLMICDALL
ncbi:hypothetical protein Y032_0278g1151 [Ancylostoma ceylanicum]|uniref:Uncharacterized protein n=1 Tax=Ancylostoma ceylanicum TaxID=53326 RepID=A0A016S7N6_9BILA|nr:hypothetical protein Y032_0278g1151 [Ancylostoma ceylanicum]